MRFRYHTLFFCSSTAKNMKTAIPIVVPAEAFVGGVVGPSLGHLDTETVIGQIFAKIIEFLWKTLFSAEGGTRFTDPGTGAVKERVTAFYELLFVNYSGEGALGDIELFESCVVDKNKFSDRVLDDLKSAAEKEDFDLYKILRDRLDNVTHASEKALKGMMDALDCPNAAGYSYSGFSQAEKHHWEAIGEYLFLQAAKNADSRSVAIVKQAKDIINDHLRKGSAFFDGDGGQLSSFAREPLLLSKESLMSPKNVAGVRVTFVIHDSSFNIPKKLFDAFRSNSSDLFTLYRNLTNKTKGIQKIPKDAYLTSFFRRNREKKPKTRDGSCNASKDIRSSQTSSSAAETSSDGSKEKERGRSKTPSSMITRSRRSNSGNRPSQDPETVASQQEFQFDSSDDDYSLSVNSEESSEAAHDGLSLKDREDFLAAVERCGKLCAPYIPSGSPMGIASMSDFLVMMNRILPKEFKVDVCTTAEPDGVGLAPLFQWITNCRKVGYNEEGTCFSYDDQKGIWECTWRKKNSPFILPKQRYISNYFGSGDNNENFVNPIRGLTILSVNSSDVISPFAVPFPFIKEHEIHNIIGRFNAARDIVEASEAISKDIEHNDDANAIECSSRVTTGAKRGRSLFPSSNQQQPLKNRKLSKLAGGMHPLGGNDALKVLSDQLSNTCSNTDNGIVPYLVREKEANENPQKSSQMSSYMANCGLCIPFHGSDSEKEDIERLLSGKNSEDCYPMTMLEKILRPAVDVFSFLPKEVDASRIEESVDRFTRSVFEKVVRPSNKELKPSVMSSHFGRDLTTRPLESERAGLSALSNAYVDRTEMWRMFGNYSQFDMLRLLQLQAIYAQLSNSTTKTIAGVVGGLHMWYMGSYGTGKSQTVNMFTEACPKDFVHLGGKETTASLFTKRACNGFTIYDEPPKSMTDSPNTPATEEACGHIVQSLTGKSLSAVRVFIDPKTGKRRTCAVDIELQTCKSVLSNVPVKKGALESRMPIIRCKTPKSPYLSLEDMERLNASRVDDAHKSQKLDDFRTHISLTFIACHLLSVGCIPNRVSIEYGKNLFFSLREIMQGTYPNLLSAPRRPDQFVKMLTSSVIEDAVTRCFYADAVHNKKNGPYGTVTLEDMQTKLPPYLYCTEQTAIFTLLLFSRSFFPDIHWELWCELSEKIGDYAHPLPQYCIDRIVEECLPKSPSARKAIKRAMISSHQREHEQSYSGFSKEQIEYMRDKTAGTIDTVHSIEDSIVVSIESMTKYAERDYPPLKYYLPYTTRGNKNARYLPLTGNRSRYMDPNYVMVGGGPASKICQNIAKHLTSSRKPRLEGITPSLISPIVRETMALDVRFVPISVCSKTDMVASPEFTKDIYPEASYSGNKDGSVVRKALISVPGRVEYLYINVHYLKMAPSDFIEESFKKLGKTGCFTPNKTFVVPVSPNCMFDAHKTYKTPPVDTNRSVDGVASPSNSSKHCAEKHQQSIRSHGSSTVVRREYAKDCDVESSYPLALMILNLSQSKVVTDNLHRKPQISSFKAFAKDIIVPMRTVHACQSLDDDLDDDLGDDDLNEGGIDSSQESSSSSSIKLI